MRINGLYVCRSGSALSLPHGRPSRGRAVLREDGDDALTMEVRFSPYDHWYRIDSFWEGSFMERTVKGAFARTIKNRTEAIKVLFNHGSDFQIGDKILGVPDSIIEADDSPVMEVPLLDTSYNRDLVPGLRAGGYGSSFMFEVIRDEWNHEPDASDINPDALPERTIREVKLYEAGPVTWPANPDATAGLRSVGSDHLLSILQDRDAARFDTLARGFKAFRAAHDLREGRLTPAPGDPARHAETITNDSILRAAQLREAQLAILRSNLD